MEIVGDGSKAVYVAQKVVKDAEPLIAALRQLLWLHWGAITLAVVVVVALMLVIEELIEEVEVGAELGSSKEKLTAVGRFAIASLRDVVWIRWSKDGAHSTRGVNGAKSHR